MRSAHRRPPLPRRARGVVQMDQQPRAVRPRQPGEPVVRKCAAESGGRGAKVAPAALLVDPRVERTSATRPSASGCADPRCAAGRREAARGRGRCRAVRHGRAQGSAGPGEQGRPATQASPSGPPTDAMKRRQQHQPRGEVARDAPVVARCRRRSWESGGLAFGDDADRGNWETRAGVGDSRCRGVLQRKNVARVRVVVGVVVHFLWLQPFPPAPRRPGRWASWTPGCPRPCEGARLAFRGLHLSAMAADSSAEELEAARTGSPPAQVMPMTARRAAATSADAVGSMAPPSRSKFGHDVERLDETREPRGRGRSGARPRACAQLAAHGRSRAPARADGRVVLWPAPRAQWKRAAAPATGDAEGPLSEGRGVAPSTKRTCGLREQRRIPPGG